MISALDQFYHEWRVMFLQENSLSPFASTSSASSQSSDIAVYLSNIFLQIRLEELQTDCVDSFGKQLFPATPIASTCENYSIRKYLQPSEEVIRNRAPYPSQQNSFVCNVVAFNSILCEGTLSRFLSRESIPAVCLSCVMNYEIRILPNGNPTLLTWEPATAEHQKLCHQEALQYSEVKFSLDLTFQSDWFSYFNYYYNMSDIFNIWKGEKFVISSHTYPPHLERGMTLTSNITFQKGNYDNFLEEIKNRYFGNQIGCVVIFQAIDVRYELIDMWFSWILMGDRLYIVDIQNSRIYNSLNDAIGALGWTTSPHSEVFYAVLKKDVCLKQVGSRQTEVIPLTDASNGNLKTSSSSIIPSHHRKLIHQILHRTALVRNFSSPPKSMRYRIVELEYYYSSPTHPDPYVHLDPHQSYWMCWYFHRQNGKSYKGGTYKGLDITIGDIGSPLDMNPVMTEGTNIMPTRGAGGLLIRSIMNIETSEVIQGPCKVVNELLRQSNSHDLLSVHDLVIELQNSALSNNLPVRIESQEKLTFQRIKSNGQMILRSPRVGLTFRRILPVIGKNYLMAPYRYTYSNIDYKANKPLLTILEINLNKLLNQKFYLNKKLSKNTNVTQDWLRFFHEGVSHRNEDLIQDSNLNDHHEYFQRRMSKYCNIDWKVADLCYLYGYLTSTDPEYLKDMIDYETERE